MLSTVSLVVAALSTRNEIALALVGGAFILFALVSSFVLPARYPDFPGRHVGWYVAAGILFFVAMISAVLAFGVEKKEAAPTEQTTTAAATTTTASTGTTATSTATQGDAVAGKSVFSSAGCSGCHTLKAAGATGTVGPNLDQAKPDYRLATSRVTNGKGVMPSFKGQLSDQQIADVAAFVVKATGGTPP
jgi:mono/diheme cytochrome c family protein